jgi:hypothetical protein
MGNLLISEHKLKRSLSKTGKKNIQKKKKEMGMKNQIIMVAVITRIGVLIVRNEVFLYSI